MSIRRTCIRASKPASFFHECCTARGDRGRSHFWTGACFPEKGVKALTVSSNMMLVSEVSSGHD